MQKKQKNKKKGMNMMKNDKTDENLILKNVQEIDSETMELLLNYIYTGQVQDFNRVSVVDLFKAADR